MPRIGSSVDVGDLEIGSLCSDDRLFRSLTVSLEVFDDIRIVQFRIEYVNQCLGGKRIFGIEEVFLYQNGRSLVVGMFADEMFGLCRQFMIDIGQT